MIKFDFKLDLTENELGDLLRTRMHSALNVLMAEVASKGKALAAEKLKEGLEHWQRGFNVHKVDEDFFIVSVDGKLANWMEDGIKTGEVSKAIMSGNRAQINKGQGKDYVDVPFEKGVDANGNIGKTGVNIRAFANAEQLSKAVSFSDYKKRGIRQEQRVMSRVQEIIKSVEPKSSETKFLTIRRVTDDSVWPSSPFKGAKVLEDLSTFINENFDIIMARLI